MTFTDGPITAEWREDGLFAWLRDESGGWIAHLKVEQWFGDYEREAGVAWVVSWLKPGGETPEMLTAAIESPALTADDPERQRQLIGLATDAMQSLPLTPAPFALPPPTPTSPDEWSQHFDLQLHSWESAFGELQHAAKADGPAAEADRYRYLTQSLDWIYAMDSSLQLQWRKLPQSVREERSAQTDKAAHRAAEHNSRGALPFNLETDVAFAAYVRRLDDKQPYAHWSETQLAGVFQSQFFLAIAWVRGQLIHAATSAPMDLRQFRPGAEPRWKWRESELFARGRSDDPGRRLYDRILAGHDVTGLLLHLREVFIQGGFDIRRLQRPPDAPSTSS